MKLSELKTKLEKEILFWENIATSVPSTFKVFDMDIVEDKGVLSVANSTKNQIGLFYMEYMTALTNGEKTVKYIGSKNHELLPYIYKTMVDAKHMANTDNNRFIVYMKETYGTVLNIDEIEVEYDISKDEFANIVETIGTMVTFYSSLGRIQITLSVLSNAIEKLEGTTKELAIKLSPWHTTGVYEGWLENNNPNAFYLAQMKRQAEAAAAGQKALNEARETLSRSSNITINNGGGTGSSGSSNGSEYTAEQLVKDCLLLAGVGVAIYGGYRLYKHFFGEREYGISVEMSELL